MKVLEFLGDIADSGDWRTLWERDAYQHPSYLPAELNVAATHQQSAYYLPEHLRPPITPPQKRGLTPHTLLATDDAGPVLGLALSVERLEGETRLSAYGRPLQLVEDRHASGPRRKTAAKLIYRRLEELRRDLGATTYQLRDPLHGGQLSSLAELVLRDGGSAHLFFTQVIDLRLPLETIQADFRPSLRNLLRRTRPGFCAQLVTSENVTIRHRDALRRLHVGMHGRDMRTPEGWEALHDCVRTGNGFMVFAKDGDDYTAGAYFPSSARYCYYAIGVNDTSRYGAGLSHLVLWRAIEHSHQQGLHYFEVGDRIYPGQHRYVQEKFHTISHFKAGFGHGVAARLDVFPAELPPWHITDRRLTGPSPRFPTSAVRPCSCSAASAFPSGGCTRPLPGADFRSPWSSRNQQPGRPATAPVCCRSTAQATTSSIA
jgi:hypothetical protein